ncbi:hypothetical protein [Streptomyces sp. WM6386]|uniref:hypothetical protein n=1 Tax=Streptomyces sp. WM6386 TaxID=1415558 RepID=UPI0019002307|nr:hypothetical protein [Streptomyces sp. WM6386]
MARGSTGARGGTPPPTPNDEPRQAVSAHAGCDDHTAEPRHPQPPLPTSTSASTSPACATSRPSLRTPKCTSLSRAVTPYAATSKGSSTAPVISSRSALVYRASRTTGSS